MQITTPQTSEPSQPSPWDGEQGLTQKGTRWHTNVVVCSVLQLVAQVYDAARKRSKMCTGALKACGMQAQTSGNHVHALLYAEVGCRDDDPAKQHCKMCTGALKACGMEDQVVHQLLNSQQAGTSGGGFEQCLVCFEDVQPAALTVQLPCAHCTCNDCWQVSSY